MNYSQLLVIRWLECAVAGAIVLGVTMFVVSRLKQPRDRINSILMAFFAAIVISPLAAIVHFSTWHAGVFSSVDRRETRPAHAFTAARMEPMEHRDAQFSRVELGEATDRPVTEFHSSTGEPSSSQAVSSRWFDLWQIAAIGLVGSYGAAAVLFLV